MKTIHFLCYYGPLDSDRNLAINPSGVTKMTYIITSLKKSGYIVKIISSAPTKNRFFCHYSSKFEKIDSNESIFYIDTFGFSSKILRFLSIFWHRAQLIKYLLYNVKKNSILIVYHSLAYRFILPFIKIIIKPKIVLDIEEIYSIATKRKKSIQNKEIKYLKNVADSYILVNDIMSDILQLNHPYVVAYSSYNLVESRFYKNETKIIQLVYAGIIEKIKMGAFIAVNSAKYLDNRFYLNILGFGQDKDIQDLKKLIDNINKEKGFEIVKFHGSLHGKDYSNFLSKCDIGLSTHTSDGDFVDLSFPSKLIVYIAHNVIPVCAKIPCVTESKIKDLVVYYEENTPESVAKAVINTNLSLKKDMSGCIMKLDQEFNNDLKNLLTNL